MPELFPGDPAGSHLSSNNPFRNRAVSPSLPQSPTSPFADLGASSRPVSRNPFLDPVNSSSAAAKSNSALLIDVDNMSALGEKEKSQSAPNDIFSSLTADGKPAKGPGPAPADPKQRSRSPYAPGESGRGRPAGPPPRVKNIPPRRSPSPNHRPSRSQEEANRKRQPVSGPAPGRPGPPGSGPSNRRPPPAASRPRRNSESSVAGGREASKEKGSREGRREGSGRDRSARPNRRNDIIDQMDATSIFGTVFHHDGPFDALNPHRNRKGSRRAPMQAFPKDSLNNVLGGSGPLNTRPDHKTFMGHNDDEAFRDFATGHEKKVSSGVVVPVFDPTSRGDVLHGDETLGLGTSTFLEGTPAALTTIQRTEAERAQDMTENSLQRKKSLAQRFRNINRGPREPGAGRAYSSDPASRAARYNAAEQSDSRPFDEYEPSKGDEVLSVRRKGSAVAVPASPPHALERRSTADGSFPAPPSYDPAAKEEASKPIGLLGRMKSLKGGRRPAPPPPVRDS